MANAKLVTIKKSPDHENIFLSHYDWLLKNARDLCRGSREEAEDLVQDMYVSFVLSHASVEIRDADALRGYLYRTLKNLFIRKNRRNRDLHSHLAISDYDSIEIALSAVDGNELLRVRTRLSEICEYARVRRLSHKAASVLILRFFFGYLPSEIAKILRTNRAAVDRLTHTARLEVRACVTRPGAIHFLQQPKGRGPEHSKPRGRQSAGSLPDEPSELKAELRRRILSWNDGVCWTNDELVAGYQPASQQFPGTTQLAHLVTCRPCLDTLNEILGIPSLDMHFFMDEGDGDGNPPDNSRTREQAKTRLRRKKREAFEHRPSQLNVAVNGHLLGTAAVNGELNELQLSLSSVSHPESIEVFSEQGITLQYFDLLESGIGNIPAPRAHVELSDRRTLALELVWGSDGLSVNVAYHDLPHGAEQTLEGDTQPESSRRQDRGMNELAEPERRPGAWRRVFNSYLSGDWITTAPAIFSAGILLSAAVIWIHSYKPQRHTLPPLSPEALLDRSIQNQATSIPPGGATHQTFSYEVREDGGRVVQSGTVDSLRGSSRSALRLFSARGKLLAGQWTDVSGKVTDRTFKERWQSHKQAAEPGNDEWTHVPQVEDFRNLTTSGKGLGVEPVRDGYEIDYHRTAPSDAPAIVDATLVLSKDTCRPIQETLRVDARNHIREYRFRELTYEVLPPSPRLEDDFTPPTIHYASGTALEDDNSAQPSNAHIALQALMVLSILGQNVERTVNLERTSDGGVSLSGVFPTTAEKNEVQRVFAPLRSGRRLILDFHAVDEPVHDRSPRPDLHILPIGQVSIEGQHIPFDSVLRTTLVANGVPEAGLDARIHSLAKQALADCSQLHSEAWTIEGIATLDFTRSELQNMSPEEQVLWLTLLDRHLRAFETERSLLETSLDPFLFGQGVRSADLVEQRVDTITSVDEFRSATQSLNQNSERLDRLLTAGLTLSTANNRSTGNYKDIGQLLTTLRDEESTLHDTVEHLQSIARR